MQQRIAEIEQSILHQDKNLAIRRMLDICLDSNNNSLLHKAIEWSRNARKEDVLSTKSTENATIIFNEIAALPPSNFAVNAPLLHAKEISKTYGHSNFSLSTISLEIKSGDVLGVVGENGNGKTTLLRCLSGQLALNSGTLQYHQLSKPDYFDIKHHVAFIPQRIPRWYGLLKDNLHFAAAIAGLHGHNNELMVDFMLERLNLSKYAHLTWNQISSGYRTRFEIARILLQKPSLLILDEPLANLDINAQQTILTDLRFLAKSTRQPMGVILSSQQLHEVEKIADNVLLIKNGACTYNTQLAAASIQSFALEIETTASRTDLLQILANEGIQLQFNGGFYTITSTNTPVHLILHKLIQKEIPVTYFRDITHSTKRFF
jgi:ABC-2 type transport system ATP-binding protein